MCGVLLVCERERKGREGVEEREREGVERGREREREREWGEERERERGGESSLFVFLSNYYPLYETSQSE